MVSNRQRFNDGPQTACAGFTFHCLTGDAAQSVFFKFQLDVFHAEQSLVLLDQSIFRLGQNINQRVLIQFF